MSLQVVESAWEELAVAVATEIVNDETASPTGFGTYNTIDIQGVDEIMLCVKTFALDTATSIDLYPQVADSAGEWLYIADAGGDPWVWNIDGTTRKNRALPVIRSIRGVTFRVLVGSTGTAGNETLSLDVMRFKNQEV